MKTITKAGLAGALAMALAFPAIAGLFSVTPVRITMSPRDRATAVTINKTVSGIWDTGQRVATNTVHIPTLYKTNAVAGEILASALNINAAAEAIEAHANGCPGCPQCMLKH